MRDHPVATKRFLRAILKAADFCAAEPGARPGGSSMSGFAERYDYALQTIDGGSLRPAGTSTTPRTRMRFYALRLHEVGMIKSSPNALLAEGTDWRFLNELKRELKA